MTLRKTYFGSVGPFYHDDTELVDDPDGDFSGQTRESTITDGQHRITEAPIEDEHSVRKADLDVISVKVEVADITDPVELNDYGGEFGTVLLAYEKVAADRNYFTLYSLDLDGPAVSSPQIVDAKGTSGERWIAIGGKYVAGDVAHHADQHSPGEGDAISGFTVAKNGGNNVWVQTTAPTAVSTGDIWIET